MIIVSQDRESIYNFSNIKAIDIVANEIYITDDILADSGVYIGKYKTKERAKEVLQEIINKYLEYATISTMTGTDIRQICVIPRKYEMPKE